jgi:hypothetical protein
MELVEGPDFVSVVDATAGGFPPSRPYTYVKLRDDGMQMVDVTDADAFASMDWDLAFRRYIIRLNSGVSGPSCVAATMLPVGTLFDDVVVVPDDAIFDEEAYFNESCTLIEDHSGIRSPGTVLQHTWEYPGCVKMTHNVYIVRLATGRSVKLEQLAFYDHQDVCDVDGTFENYGGHVRIKWAWLD